MSAGVKRSYAGDYRRAQAGLTRDRILTAARVRFLRDGYAATTVGEIAADADVSIQTVYKTFTNKAGLIKALFDTAVVGDSDPVPLAARSSIAAVVSEPDPRRKIAMFAAMCAQIVPRAAPIQLLAREASATDADLAAIYAQIRAERLTGLAGFADHLHQQGHLANGVTPEEARDVLWTYNSPELYDLLVVQRGWTVDRYQTHIVTAVTAALLR